ncbi:MAG: hypothetical protein PVI97_16160 [Candidatus Thiodiazotropha sp.]
MHHFSESFTSQGRITTAAGSVTCYAGLAPNGLVRIAATVELATTITTDYDSRVEQLVQWLVA